MHDEVEIPHGLAVVLPVLFDVLVSRQCVCALQFFACSVEHAVAIVTIASACCLFGYAFACYNCVDNVFYAICLLPCEI